MNYSFTDDIQFVTLNVSEDSIKFFFLMNPLKYLYFIDDEYIGCLTLEAFRKNNYTFDRSILQNNLLVVYDFEDDAYIFESKFNLIGVQRILLYASRSRKYREIFIYQEKEMPFEVVKKINASYVLSEFDKDLDELFSGKKVACLIRKEFCSQYLLGFNIIKSLDDLRSYDLVLDACINKSDEKYFYNQYPSLISIEDIVFKLLLKRLKNKFFDNKINLVVYDMPGKANFELTSEELNAIAYKTDIIGAFRNQSYIEKIFDNPDERDAILSVGENAYNISLINNQGRFRKVTGSKSIHYTIRNDRRLTCWNNETFINEVHFFGPCITFGLFSTDRFTIESILQKKMNDNGLRYNINNYGVPDGGDLINDILYMLSTQMRENDYVIWINRFNDNLKQILASHNIRVIDLSQAFYGQHNFFVNDTIHTTEKGNKIIAEYIFKNINFNKSDINYKTVAPTSFKFVKIDNRYEQYLISEKVSGFHSYGSIVINANPFTFGHKYLIDKALETVDFLYVFLVENSSKSMPFYERYIIAKEAIGENKRVKLLSAGDFFASEQSFNAYFWGENDFDAYKHVEYFLRIVAPILNITYRFFGTEPNNMICRKFNEYCMDELPKNGVNVIQIQRKCNHGNSISASKVRELLGKGELDMYNELISPWATMFLIHKERFKNENYCNDERV